MHNQKILIQTATKPLHQHFVGQYNNIRFFLCFLRCLLFSERHTAPAGAAVSQPVPVSVWGHPADVGPECKQQSSLPRGIQLPDQRGPGDPA